MNHVPTYLGEVSLDKETLAHHGIEGMHWGVRNGPPYPLDRSISTGKSLKKGAKETNKKSSGGKKETKSQYGSMTALLLSTVAPVGITLLASALASAAINRGVQKAQQVAKKKTFQEMQVIRETEKVDSKTGFKKKANKDATPEEDLRMTNALRGDKNKTAKNTFNNCTYCTTAYDLRRRGFDVVAGSTKRGTTTDDIASWYKGGKFDRAAFANRTMVLNTAKNRQAVKDYIVQHSGEGSRGNLCVTWAQGYGSGHSMAYEVTNGKLVIRDGQSGKSYTSDKKVGLNTVDHILAQTMLTKVDFMRTDNLTPNYELLKKRGIIV